MFDKLTKVQLLGLVTRYNLINRLSAGYSKFTKPQLIAELKNHIHFNVEKKQFETISNTIHLKAKLVEKIKTNKKNMKDITKKLNAVKNKVDKSFYKWKLE